VISPLLSIEFQFLGRNSGRSDPTGALFADAGHKVSIPRSEFWSFGRRAMTPRHCPNCGFQFLGRNSGRSDRPRRSRWCSPLACFNSSVGILVVRTPGVLLVVNPATEFQFLGRNSGRSDQGDADAARIEAESFNSSVGILVVRTRRAHENKERTM